MVYLYYVVQGKWNLIHTSGILEMIRDAEFLDILFALKLP